jgi:two-component system, OmpR family, alkaline phosphatase synthesis response regulator PhoP
MAPPPKKILVVEDDKLMLVLLSDTLKEFPGAKVYQARNGLEGLSIAKLIHPDLIITDITMPGMDGIAMIKAIRDGEDAELKNIPIVALTAHDDLQGNALEVRASIVVEKPTKQKQLFQFVEMLIGSDADEPKK